MSAAGEEPLFLNHLLYECPDPKRGNGDEDHGWARFVLNMNLNSSHIQVWCPTHNQKPGLPFVGELSDGRMWRQLDSENKKEFARKISIQLVKTLCDKSGDDNVFEKLALFAAGRHLPLHKYHDAKAVSMLVEAGADVKKGGGLRYNILRWSRVTSDDAYRVLCESQSPASMYFELPWGAANCVDAWTLIREMKTLDGEDMQARLLLHMREALLSGTYDVQKWRNALLGGELLPPQIVQPPMLQSQPERISWCTFNCGGKLTPLLVRAILALTGPEVDYNVVLMLQEVRREEAATQAIVEQAVQPAPGQTPLPFVVVSEPGISAPGSLTVVGGECVI